MTLPLTLSGRLAALAMALLSTSGASAASAPGAPGADKPAELERLGLDLPWNKFEAADLDRRRQARLLRQGTQGGLYRQRGRRSGRYENDLRSDDGLSRPRPDAGGRPCANAGSRPCAGAGSRTRRGAGAKQTPDGQSGPATDAGVKRLEAKGPVTVISKTQVATGDNGSYDKTEGKVYLIGHVTLSDGQNVTKGDKLTYDLKTAEATVDTSGKSSRVHGQFVPKSSADTAKPGADAAKPGGDAAKTGADTAKAK